MCFPEFSRTHDYCTGDYNYEVLIEVKGKLNFVVKHGFTVSRRTFMESKTSGYISEEIMFRRTVRETGAEVAEKIFHELRKENNLKIE
jgi:hypothetical protein